MRVRRVGASALLIECRDGEHVEAWRGELERRRDVGDLLVTDLVPGARTVLVDGVPPGTESLLESWAEPTATVSAEGPSIEIPTLFDGIDLPDVAALWKVDVAVAITRLVDTPLTVGFCGFAPGFAYLRGLPEEWSVPRLVAPRPRVAPGSVALAGAYTGIYPSASPGGWRLVGRTAETLFDVRREPPALLSPGTRVRLVPA